MRKTKSKDERELGRRARKIMSNAHGCSSPWGGGDIYPAYANVGPLTIRRLDGEISIRTSEAGHNLHVTVYEEDKFGTPTKPLMLGAVKAALELLKRHMVLEDIAGV